MRLIDADKVEKDIRNYADKKCCNGEIELANGILKTLTVIKEQPTAYDVDKVIEQIGKKMFSAELHDNGWDGQTINELLCMGDVYEIVKAGGVDE